MFAIEFSTADILFETDSARGLALSSSSWAMVMEELSIYILKVP